MIVATAGHVDHGKTSLVKALTGVDADRLPEEKRRGMTLDLGFAYRGALGFVDVPGHERFVHNMLCGVAGIDLVLFVVAADDGPMPQTREHLAILDLLGVPRGVVALTKIDRVGPERIAQVQADIAALLSPTRFAGAPVFALSSLTGEGVAELSEYLDHCSVERRKTDGHFRLSLDRCFTVAGAGLVVTGTALSGEIAVGDEVRALLADTSARVRSIHAHNAPAQRGRAGERLALNLAGLDARQPIARGDWIVRGDLPPPVQRFDARLRLLEPLRNGAPVHLHLGAADVLGRVALLDENGLAQLVLDKPVGAVHGDGFILRDPSARRTVAGGRVVDVFAPARGRAKPQRLAQLAAMELADPDAALEALLAHSPLGVDLARFARNRNIGDAGTGWKFSRPHWITLRDQVLNTLAQWHARFPDAVGPAAEHLMKGLAPEALLTLLDELEREGRLVREPLGVRLATHRVELSAADLALWGKLEPKLAALRPPPVAELAALIGADAKTVEAMLSRAARQGKVVRVSKNRFFLPSFIKDLAAMAAEAADERGITAAAFRDRSGIGRNLAIEVLEYFDRIKLTRRVGDAHLLRRPPGYFAAKQ